MAATRTEHLQDAPVRIYFSKPGFTEAEQRQVEGAQVALQHNLGLGEACVMTMYRKD